MTLLQHLYLEFVFIHDKTIDSWNREQFNREWLRIVTSYVLSFSLLIETICDQHLVHRNVLVRGRVLFAVGLSARTHAPYLGLL